MDIDIGFWLSLGLLITLVLWAADRYFGWTQDLPAEGEPVPAGVEPSKFAETVAFSNSLIPVLGIVLVVRSFIFEPFTIPSGSMLPTLQVHDFIVVNKFSYGLRLPVTNTLIFETGEPERGDVMVFRYPRNPSQNYIKRVLAIPGDVITLRGDRVWVNGSEVPRELLRTSIVESGQARGKLVERSVFAEQIDGTRHLMQLEPEYNPLTGERSYRAWDKEVVVPEGSYFVMGDNRDNSLDSRFWGFVPEENIVGKASVIWMHWEGLTSLPSFSRNGAIDKLEETQ